MSDHTISNAQQRANYHTYIQSPEWKARRLQVHKRAKGKCERFGVRLRHGWHCHHLTYAHFGNEPLEDLQALCEFCHRDGHGMKRLRRKKKRRHKTDEELGIERDHLGIRVKREALWDKGSPTGLLIIRRVGV